MAMQNIKVRCCSPDMKYLVETGCNHSDLMFWRSAPAKAYGVGGYVAESSWSQWMPCAHRQNHADAAVHAFERLRQADVA